MASAPSNSDCSGICADLLVLVHGIVVTDCSGTCTDLTHVVCSIYVRLCCQSAWLGYLVTLWHEKKACKLVNWTLMPGQLLAYGF